MSCGCGCNGAPGGCGHDHGMGASISYMPIEMGRSNAMAGRTRNPIGSLTPRTALVVGALLGGMLGFYVQRKVRFA